MLKVITGILSTFKFNGLTCLEEYVLREEKNSRSCRQHKPGRQTRDFKAKLIFLTHLAT